MPKTTNIVRPAAEITSDPARIQGIVDRRLAMRLGVSLPVAAVVASLAGLGPRTERVGR